MVAEEVDLKFYYQLIQKRFAGSATPPEMSCLSCTSAKGATLRSSSMEKNIHFLSHLHRYTIVFLFSKFDDDEIRFNLNLYPQARYCNAACQKADWDRHKDFCMLMQKIKSQLKSKEGSEQM